METFLSRKGSHCG